MSGRAPLACRKRILFMHSSDEFYGADVVLLQLVTGLDRRQYEPIVVLPSDIPYEGKLSAALEGVGIQYYSMRMGVIRRRYFSLTGLPRYLMYLTHGTVQLTRLVKQHQIDLIHSNTSAIMGGALVARLFGLPHVWHVHEIIEQPAWLGRLIYRIILANSTKVVAISQAVAHCISKREAPSHVEVVWNGIDCTRFSPQVDDDCFRAKWGVAPDEVLVGVVGRISRWKGQELFLEAASKVVEVCPRIQFAIVGDPVPGEESRLLDLRRQANRLGLGDELVFHPFTDKVHKVMRALDILVLPSTLPEPLGLVVLEAMASERPVIAAAHGGPLETIVPDETGLLFNPGDADALAKKIVQLANNAGLRKDMGRKGRQHVLEHFSLDRFSQRFNGLYNDLLLKNCVLV